MSEIHKVLISDPLPGNAREILEQSGGIEVIEGSDQIEGCIAEIRGWIVRSGTRITADYLERARQLSCICRAGAGVDNIDLEEATRRGVVVMNTPGSNSMAAAEHTVALMLSLARNIPFAHATMMAGGWGRKNYVGVEVEGKTLGVLGLGKVGRIVARKAAGLGMKVLGYDPYVSSDVASEMGMELATVEEILEQADFVALHTPLTEETRGLIGADSLARCRPGIRIINGSRGGVVDEEALLAAIDGGRVAGAALDVFAEEPPPEDSPLRNHPKVITTPHLGASTVEAQAQVSVASGFQVRDFLLEGTVVNAVNTVSLVGADRTRLAPFVTLARRLGALQAQVLNEQPERVSVEVEASGGGEVLERLALDGALVGFLGGTTDEPVNAVNARYLAKQRGIDLSVRSLAGASQWSRSLALEVQGSAAGIRRVVGAVAGENSLRLVRFEGYSVDGLLEGPLIITVTVDQPGMVGRLGKLLGDRGLNIANLSLGRDEQGGTAVTVFNLDSPAPPEVLDELRACDGVDRALAVQIPD